MAKGSRKVLPLLLAVAVSTQALAASPKDQFKQFAVTQLKEMADSGEPKSRCSLNALFVQDGLVARKVGETPLAVGDHVRTINGVTVKGKPYSELRGVLQSIPAGSLVTLVIDRDGETKTLQASCVDALPANVILRDALTAASKGKFDECMTVIGAHEELGSEYWLLRLNCAAYSKGGGGKYDPENAYRWLLGGAEDVRLQPDVQGKFLDALHKAEPVFASAGRMDLHGKIVDMTRTWPNAKTNGYESSTPNWGRFRRKTEEALKARLIDPASAQFTWSNGFLFGTWKPLLLPRVTGYWTCGLVNARNRMGGFAGTTSFVVVMPDENTVSYVEVGTNKDFDLLSTQCQKGVKLLPPAPPELTAADSLPSGTMSVADELQKLAALRDKGIITQAEFDSQKAKLLGR